MARKPNNRVNVYIPTELLPLAGMIENFSAFVQIALEQAPDIMTFAILHEKDPKKYHYRRKIEEVIDPFNKKYPLDPRNKLTPIIKRRQQGEWQTNSQQIPDVLL